VDRGPEEDSVKLEVSPLTIALTIGQSSSAVELLLDSGADINRHILVRTHNEGEYGFAPESFALMNSNISPQTFQRALEEWIDFEAQNTRGETVETFMEKKADRCQQTSFYSQGAAENEASSKSTTRMQR